MKRKHTRAQAAAHTAASCRVIALLLTIFGITIVHCSLEAARATEKLGMEAQYAISSALGREQPRYHFRKSGSGFEAANAGQRLSARFTSRGAEIVVGKHRLGMGLTAWGRGPSLSPVAGGPIKAAENRVEYERGAVTEWYVNGPLGLQQGFTVKGRPAVGSGPLTLELGLWGDLTPRVNAGRTGLTLCSELGETELQYTGLTVEDAAKRKLPSWLETAAGGLLVRVDDRDARYPVRIDPFVQSAKLTVHNGAAGTSFGWSVAVSEDTVVVGAYHENIPPNFGQGSVYVFVKPQTGWANMTQTAKLTAADGAAADLFGVSVAVDGDTIVAGAWQADVTNADQGAAYVFVKPAGGWADMTQTAKLTAADGGVQDYFGSSVAVGGETVVVGANFHDGANVNQGSAYVFMKPPAGWADMTQTAKLTASDGGTSNFFGRSVAVSGDMVVVGADGNKVGANEKQGAAYVFVRPPTGWLNMTERAKLTASDGRFMHLFGLSVAFSGDTVVVGAGTGGGAYVFEKPSAGWMNMTQTAKLTSSDGGPLDFVVSVSGDLVVVGAHNDRVGGNPNQGSAYLFVKPPAGWVNMNETIKLTASDGAWADIFGMSLAACGDTVVAGAPGADIGGNPDRGAAYVLRIVGPYITSLPAGAVPGSQITIGGLGFRGPLQLFFNGVPVNFVIVDDTTLRVTVPELPPGAVTITVTTGEGTFTVSADSDVFVVRAAGGIPTLSEWGLLLLLSTLAGAGLYSLGRQKIQRHRT